MTSLSRFSWYFLRVAKMSPAEIAWRAREQALRRVWTRRQVLPGQFLDGTVPGVLPDGERRFTATLPAGTESLVPKQARCAILADAERILKGEWEMFSVVRDDMMAPDWFFDPVTGQRSNPSWYALRINQRSEEQVGNIKQVWEVNRLQHLTLLAVSWYLTHEDAYAERVAEQLRSWCESNPFLSGVNWTSGIELGIRLINFVWIRRLLSDWPGVENMFEDNDLVLRQIRWHQEYLAAFESRGSSANNHVIAEAAGQLAASCAFPWFAESTQWRIRSAALLERSLRSNTFPSGINRELASDYHGFVFELGIFAALEASAAGFPVSSGIWGLLCSMVDCMAALADSRGRPPRQGDSDEGRVVLLDAPSHNRLPTLLTLGDALFGRLEWWPAIASDAGAALVSGLVKVKGAHQEVKGRAARRPERFEDAGISIARTNRADSPEIWCRCDGGPHGFLSIAAHAHADALSVEVRYDGVDILADPGTYCYHGEPEWRKYFQSTIGHNTVEIGEQWQSARGGAFLWLRHAQGREIEFTDSGDTVRWVADHGGYRVLRPPVTHRRQVSLYREASAIEIVDEIDGSGHEVRLAFHLGPSVHADLDGHTARLSWSDHPSFGKAIMALPSCLEWSLHRGETNPILGWYSDGLGHREPSITLVGKADATPGVALLTRLEFILPEAI